MTSTTSSIITGPATAHWTIDPGRWPDVAVAAGSPVRAAVARALFTTAVARLPLRITFLTAHKAKDAEAVDWSVLPRSQWETALADGARVEVVTAVQGG